LLSICRDSPLSKDHVEIPLGDPFLPFSSYPRFFRRGSMVAFFSSSFFPLSFASFDLLLMALKEVRFLSLSFFPL